MSESKNETVTNDTSSDATDKTKHNQSVSDINNNLKRNMEDVGKERTQYDKKDRTTSNNNTKVKEYKCTHCDFKALDNSKLQSHFQDMHLDDFVEQTIMQTLKDNMPKNLLNSGQDELNLLKERATKSFMGDIKDSNHSKVDGKEESNESQNKNGTDVAMRKKCGRPKGYSPKLAAAGLAQTNMNKDENKKENDPNQTNSSKDDSQDCSKEETKDKDKTETKPEGIEVKRIRADRSKGTCVELPNGWKRQTWLRKNGVMAGKFDVCVWNKEGQKFRSKIGLEKYCKDNNITDIDINQYFMPDAEFFKEGSELNPGNQNSITDYFKTKFDESNEIPETNPEVSNPTYPTKEKDADRHKRQKMLLQNLTPLGLWSARKKKAIMAKHPEWSLSQVARLIAAAWKKVENDEVQSLKAEIDAMNGTQPQPAEEATPTAPKVPKIMPTLPKSLERPTIPKPNPKSKPEKILAFKCKHCDHKASSAVKLDTHMIVNH